MSVKDFILLVAYLLVPIASNFALKSHLPRNCVICATHIREMEIQLKERYFESKYHNVIVKSLK